MDKHSWKLLKAIFFICSSTPMFYLAVETNNDDLKWLGAVGMIGIVIGIIMGWSALAGHAKDNRKE